LRIIWWTLWILYRHRERIWGGLRMYVWLRVRG
jgi:hypothetical protein